VANATAVKALLTLVRMPQSKYGSGKVIKHWRGSAQHSPRLESTFSQPGLSRSDRWTTDAEHSK
jgi:hypothetical protein